MTTTWGSASATPKICKAHLKAFDLVETLDAGDTTVTIADIERWAADEVYEWLEAWGFEWDGEEWVGLEADEENDGV